MEAGNPKQVAVLSVVAVVAIGFLFTRMRGQKLPTMAQAIVDKATGHSSATPPTYPMVFDPFSHPKLASSQTAASTSTPETPSTGEKTPMPPFIGGSLPPVGEVPTGEILKPGMDGTMKVTEVRPVEKPPEGTEIMLEATAGATDAVAFLSVGGAESQPYHINDSIKGASNGGKVKLLRVEDGAVVLQGPKGQLTVGVGERKRI